MQHNTDNWACCQELIEQAKNRRDWASLPASFEANAVEATVSNDYIRSMIRTAVKARIAIGKATTFSELPALIGAAQVETDRQINASIARHK